MKTILKTALVVLALSGAAAMTASSANAAGTIGFFVGPSGVHLSYQTGYYYDRFHHRHMYRYPVNWQRYNYPLSWYQVHSDWYRDHDWMDRYNRYDRDRDRDRD